MQPQDKYLQIMHLIDKELSLPSPPAIAVQILNAVQNDDKAFAELGNIIAADPALTAKMLRVANSGVFACNGEITNINRAISVLGTNLIKNVALSFVIASELNESNASDFNPDIFWRRSVTAAVSGELLAKRLAHRNEDIFVSALLQDVGMLIISRTKGDEYGKLFRESQTFATDLANLEHEKYGFNHQQVGYALMQSWNLPASIIAPILVHHRPGDASDADRASAEILYCADLIAALYNGPEIAGKARKVQAELAERFSIGPAESLSLLDEIAENSRRMIATFELDPGEIRPYSLLLQEANAELSKLNLSNEQLVLEMMEAKNRAERLARELQDANSRLRELVYRDGLTGLYNHRYFQEALANELARANRYHSSVSLILFDIDHFKQVNDTYGHPAGDLVLMNIARAVNSAVRPCDIVSRYGGEEFAVILPETGQAGVKVFSARLRRCIEGIATLVDGQLIYVTVSAGATTYNYEQPEVTKDLLIETADRGLYLSKQQGRNLVTMLEPETSANL